MTFCRCSAHGQIAGGSDGSWGDDLRSGTTDHAELTKQHRLAFQKAISIYLTILLMAVAAVSPQVVATTGSVAHAPTVQEQSISLTSAPLLGGDRVPPAKSVGHNPIPEILERIAWCESRNRQFDENGEVMRGTANPDDIGRFQINEQHWGAKAKELGYNLATEEGNRKMALNLFERYGTKPWYWSQSCWDKN